MDLPDYCGGSIVNLLRSIERALDARPCEAEMYVPLRMNEFTPILRHSDLVSRENGGIRLRVEAYFGICAACSSNLEHDALNCSSIDPDSPWPGSIFDYILIRRFLWLLAQ